MWILCAYSVIVGKLLIIFRVSGALKHPNSLAHYAAASGRYFKKDWDLRSTDQTGSDKTEQCRVRLRRFIASQHEEHLILSRLKLPTRGC